MSKEHVEVYEGSGNIFADLGLPDAETHYLKAQIVAELSELQQGLTDDPSARASNLKELKDRLQALSRQAKVPADSPDRRMARRILGGVFIDSRSVDDQEYQNFVDSLRPAR